MNRAAPARSPEPQPCGSAMCGSSAWPPESVPPPRWLGLAGPVDRQTAAELLTAAAAERLF